MIQTINTFKIITQKVIKALEEQQKELDKLFKEGL